MPWGWGGADAPAGTAGQLGATYCDRCARGGPALRTSSFQNAWAGVEGDSRYAVTPYLWTSYSRGDEGRSRGWNVSPEVNVRVASRFNASLSFSVSSNTDDSQWYGNFTDSAGATHYTFAHLEQITTALTGRVNFTFTPTLSLQAYAQPFVTKGTYSDVRELDDPRAAAYPDRFQPYNGAAVAADPGGFNFKQFRSNVVLRWEYRPGSVLYFVWATGRSASDPLEGDRDFRGNVTDLFRLPSNDTFLIKGSYWLNW